MALTKGRLWMQRIDCKTSDDINLLRLEAYIYTLFDRGHPCLRGRKALVNKTCQGGGHTAKSPTVAVQVPHF